MRLKRLYLQGYKTFANRTEFLFDEGITAVVGPNGSGKSNIADAIRWVLGEQSYRELRGRRGVDMIFSGSQKRPKASMAHVSLLLDNSNGELPIDYAEVEIGRRAYRDGANEYYINGNKVRLMDVTALLATSGLAGRTYTMIGQGLVDRALSLKADERRALFEEAAGISHYKDRRAETLRRLHETQRNLERVNDVLEEIKPRMRSLKRQASRAQDYEQVATDLRELLRVWYGYHWALSKKNLRLRREKSGSAETAWKNSRFTLETEQKRIEDLRARLNRFQQQIHEKEAERDGLREALEQLRRNVAILTEREALNSTQLRELALELPDLESRREAAQTDLTQAMTDLTAAQEAFQAEQTELATFETQFKTQQAAIVKWRGTVSSLEREQGESRRKVAQVEGQLAQLRERLQERRDESFDATSLAKNEKRVADLSASIKTLTAERDTLREQRNTIYKQRQEAIRELKQLRRTENDAGQQLNRLSKEVARLETRRDMLDQMRRKTNGKHGKAKVIAQLARLLTIPTELTTAIEAALADQLNALIVPDDADLWELVKQNSKQEMHIASLATIAATPSPELPAHKAVVGWASDLVSAEKQYADLVATLLNHILIVNDRRAAFALSQTVPAGVTVVSTDGFVARAGGIVTTGAANSANALLQQEKDWRIAIADVEAKQTELDTLQANSDAQGKIIADKQAATDELTNQDTRLNRQEQEVERKLNAQQRDLDRTRQQVSFLESQQTSQQKDIERFETRIIELEASITDQRATVVTVESNLGTAREKLAALPVAEAEQQRTSRKQSIAATRTIVAGRQAVVDSRRATLGQIESRLRRQQARHAELLKQQAQIDLAGESAKLKIAQTQMETLDTTIKPLREQRTQMLRMVSDLEADTAVHQRQAHKLETEYTEARVALAQTESHIDGLKERIHADFGVVALSYDDDETVQTPLPIGEIVEQLPVVDELPDDLEGSIQKRRGQLQRMGAINPDAPEEYAETVERVEFMEKQIEDLVVTEGQLRAVIADLDELTSREFVATVEKVNVLFGTMFQQLFGGGSAELVLTDPDDLTLTGVDIMARLPRRREQGLAVLSGGERSLTAAALVFSLLSVAPPPFCVMDEVDAALDEANVNRFRDVLRDLSLKSQFIVITHNRGTVQAANTLYGISMGNDGVSQMISIRTEDYVSAEEIV